MRSGQKRHQWPGWARSGLVLLALFVAWSAVTELRIRAAGKPLVYTASKFGEWPEEYGRIVGSLTWEWSMYLEVATGAEGGGQPDRLGKPSIGTILDHDNSNGLGANRIQTSMAGGRAERAWVYTPGPIDDSPNDRFEMGLYSDAGGAPGRLVARTPTGTLHPGWNSLPLEADLAPSTTYWLVYNTNAISAYRNSPTYTPIPDAIESQVRAFESPLARRVSLLAGYFGGMNPSLGITLTLLIVTVLLDRRLALTMLGGIALGSLIVVTSKGSLSLPYGSYPSGHVFRIVFASVWVLALVRSWWAAIAALGVTGFMAFGVVYSGGHDMPEAIGGALLGAGMASLAAGLAPRLVLFARPAVRSFDLRRQATSTSVSLDAYANRDRRPPDRPPAPHA